MNRNGQAVPAPRILLIVHDFDPGGAERTALRLAAHWAALGVDVSIACGSQHGALRPILGNSVQLYEPVKPIVRSFGSRSRLALHAASVARRLAPQIILLPGNFYAGMAPQLAFQLGRNCPPIVLKLSNALTRPGRGGIRQLMFQWSLALKSAFAQRIIVMSSELLGEARSRLPWPKGRYCVVDQPVLDDPGAVRQVHRDDGGSPTIVAAGRLVSQKNFEGLIEALRRLDQHVRLKIYGDGPLRSRLERLIDTQGLADRVELPGFSAKLEDAFANADLFVLSSDYEGFPSVLIEAINAGTPAVATDCSAAVAPILARAGLGQPVPVRDPSALARAISAALERPHVDPSALRRSVEKFRIGPSAEKYLALFRSLAPAR